MEYKDQGIITSGSVYMRDFDKSDWMSVNELDRYIPGSILKVPVLMTYLLMEEENPGTLNKKVVYDQKFQTEIKQAIVSKAIEFGKSYSYRELLEYMIVYSDNNANLLLNRDLDFNKLIKIFNDLNIKAPDNNSAVYPMTARECSRFLEVLFNATYLNFRNSEYAMNLLTRTQFKDGIMKGIPESGLLIAHKFGESGNNINHQLHETAILYLNDKPYLLTIMTSGNDNVDLSKLAEVLQKVSNAVYKGLVKIK
jgi:beta-lactamase class A